MSARPLDSYALGEYVYVRQEVRAGQPKKWRLAVVVRVERWCVVIAALRPQIRTGGQDAIGPSSCAVFTCVARGDIHPRDEVGSWEPVIEGDITALVESRRKDGGS